MAVVEEVVRKHVILLTAGALCVLTWSISRWPCMTCGGSAWCAQDSCSGVWSTPEFLTVAVLITLAGAVGTVLGMLGWSPERAPREMRVRIPRRVRRAVIWRRSSLRPLNVTVQPIKRIPLGPGYARRRTVVRRARSPDQGA